MIERKEIIMEDVYQSIVAGLSEAIEDVKSEDKKLKRHTVSIIPVKDYDAKEIRNIRKKTGLSQKLFAGYMGVSAKTVEAWEAGTNRPSGAASRILNMLEIDSELIVKFPFVQGINQDR